ncbi:MAG: replication initiation protein [Candidatus Cryptobacteroides sp.]
MKKDVIYEQSQLVIKSNWLVRKAEYDLTEQAQKILLFFISKIKPDDDDFVEYCVDLHDICDLLEITFDTNNYSKIEDSILMLTEPFIVEDNKTVFFFQWIFGGEIDKSTYNFSFHFDPRLKPHLLHLKENFTQFQLSDILKMKSKYSIRLYEYLKSYASVGNVTVSIIELKKILNTENEYVVYKDFRVNVIDKSIAEINRFTPLRISYSPVRTGRFITDLYFEIKSD